MTVTSDLSRERYVGNGVTTTFAIPFPYLTNNDGTAQISVYIGDSDSPLIEGIDYTVNNFGRYSDSSEQIDEGLITFETRYEGGEFILTETPAVGIPVVVVRNVPQTQGIVFVEGEYFPAQDFENGLDKLTMEVQEVKENLSRAIVLPPTSTEDPLVARTEILEARTQAVAAAVAAKNSEVSAANSENSAFQLVNEFTSTVQIATNEFDMHVVDKITDFDKNAAQKQNAVDISAALAENSAVNASKSADLAIQSKNDILENPGFIAVSNDLTGDNKIGYVAENIDKIADSVGLAQNAAENAEKAAAAAAIAANTAHETIINETNNALSQIEADVSSKVTEFNNNALTQTISFNENAASKQIAVDNSAAAAKASEAAAAQSASEAEETYQKMGRVYKVKGSVDDYASLPANPEIGDVYNLNDTGANYVWNGTQWDKLSETVDLSDYRTAAAQDIIDAGKQPNLVSGVNIKTIGGESLLGAGNIEVGAELNNPYTLFDSKYVEAPLYNTSWLLSEGNFHSGTVYVTAYEALQVEANAAIAVGTKTQLPSGAAYIKRGLSVKTSDYTDYDFVLDPVGGTFRLPIQNNLAGGKAVVGNGKALGLRTTANEQTYALGNNTSDNLQAFYNAAGTSAGAIVPSFTDFSNRLLGVSEQPDKSGMETSTAGIYLYYYVGETVQNAALIDAGKFFEKLADVSKHITCWDGVLPALPTVGAYYYTPKEEA